MGMRFLAETGRSWGLGLGAARTVVCGKDVGALGELAARAADVTGEHALRFLDVAVAEGGDHEVVLLVGDATGIGVPRRDVRPAIGRRRVPELLHEAAELRRLGRRV